ncbi:hypothetical protein KIW84_044670 [Lathyrus oleraceus]|uniref:Uncharacterized protein n=1 Tax=Pisum sativum TaxID=3888 RepID=A0A9D4XH38_PEA|nr:hypothetical protein KIW84_044670 [Pisum sativum]
MSSEFTYSFGHPYGPPHGFQGFIPPPDLCQGFPTGPFGPYGIYGPQPLVSQPLTSQYYGANPYGAQLSMAIGNPGYTASPATVCTYPLQEDPIDLYHCPSIHSDAAKDAVQVSGKKKNDEVSVIVLIFNKPKAFEIFCPSKESTPLVDSAKCLNIKMPALFPYKSDKVIPWGYVPTTIVNGFEKPLVNNRTVTNIVDERGLTRSGRVFTPANLRGSKPMVKNPDNCKASLVIPESRPIQDVEAEEFLRLIRKSDYKIH